MPVSFPFACLYTTFFARVIDGALDKGFAMLTREEQFYETAAKELAEDNLVQAMWGKAFSLALGDEPKTKALYMNLRVEQLEREYLNRLGVSWAQIIAKKNFVCPHCQSETRARIQDDTDFFVAILYGEGAGKCRYFCSACHVELKNDRLLNNSQFTQQHNAQPNGQITPNIDTSNGVVVTNSVKTLVSNNGFAVTGFILGLVSMPLYAIGIIPILAVIFSIIGLATFDEEKQKNKWMAGVGLALGAVFTIMMLDSYGHFK